MLYSTVQYQTALIQYGRDSGANSPNPVWFGTAGAANITIELLTRPPSTYDAYAYAKDKVLQWGN